MLGGMTRVRLIQLALVLTVTMIGAWSEQAKTAYAACNYTDGRNPYSTPGGTGQCTWWAWWRRYENGESLPKWGNAKDWAGGARGSGYSVGTVPQVGATAVWQPGVGGASSGGHVAHVEEVYSATSFRVSEMNWSGWCVVSYRTVIVQQGIEFIYRRGSQPPPVTPVPPTPGPTVAPPTPAPTVAPPPSGDISLDAPGSVQSGQAVIITSWASDSRYNTIRVWLPCGSPPVYETGAPSVSFNWSTSGCPEGQHTLRAEARLPDDPSWSRAISTTGAVWISAAPATPVPPPPPSDARSLIRCGPGVDSISGCSSNGEYGDGGEDAAWRGADGNRNSRWSSLEQHNAWWKAGFSYPVWVAQVSIWGRGGGSDIDGRLEFSDGSTVGFGTLPSDGCRRSISFSPRQTTFVRFQVTGMGGRRTSGFQEIEAYSSAIYPDGDNCSGSQPLPHVTPTPAPTQVPTATATPAPTVIATPVPIATSTPSPASPVLRNGVEVSPTQLPALQLQTVRLDVLVRNDGQQPLTPLSAEAVLVRPNGNAVTVLFCDSARSNMVCPVIAGGEGWYMLGTITEAFAPGYYTVTEVRMQLPGRGWQTLAAGTLGGFTAIAPETRMTVSTTSAVPGEPVSVSWFEFDASGNDWIGLYASGVSDETYLAWLHVYGAAGTLMFAVPQASGWYEFRLFRNGVRHTTSGSFLVSPPRAVGTVGLQSPDDGALLPGMGTTLRWTNPDGVAQVHLQVLPLNNDGPGMDIIVGDPATVAAGAYTLSAPQLGQGNYVLLPGASYQWRIRGTAKRGSIGEDDVSWGPWSSLRVFRTLRPSSASITLNPVTPSATPLLSWKDSNTATFYYEVQLSEDRTFNADPRTASAAVYWNLVHGGLSNPLNSWSLPSGVYLRRGATYYWRVRPRVQATVLGRDEPGVGWSGTQSFIVP